uniref:Proton-dependent oligopeptide transporter family n=1 Tax=Ascaris lumbricoides TaxID=6252 RepID=A0A0M3HXN2_ASCLU
MIYISSVGETTVDKAFNHNECIMPDQNERRALPRYDVYVQLVLACVFAGLSTLGYGSGRRWTMKKGYAEHLM